MNRSKKRIAVALGGNALGNTPTEQLKQVKIAAETIVELAAEGHELIVGHGNGPQVGIINSAMNYAAANGPHTPYMPFAECGAMSQGFIGYHLQQALQQSMRKRGMNGAVVSVVTQVLVDPEDPAFSNPTKPIGGFYDGKTAAKLMKENPGVTFVEDAGRGWRQVVASPKPVDIVEKDSIRSLLDDDFIVIACGGGGVPVTKDSHGDFHGVSAVVDKDFSAAKLAELVDAEYLFILTAVDHVAINYGKPNQKELQEMTLAEAERYCAEGQFAPGSMLPKVQAAMNFVKSGKGRKAIIASLEKAPEAIEGKSGTVIHM